MRAADVALVLVWFGLAGMALTVAIALALRGRETFPVRHPALAKIFFALAVTSTFAAYVGLFGVILPRTPRDPLIGGAFFGLTLGGTGAVMTLTIFGLLFLLDPKFRVKVPDPRMAVWLFAIAVVAFAVAGVLVVQMMLLIRRSGVWSLFLVPFSIGIFPLVLQVFKVPALLAALRGRQQALEPACAGELREWVAETAATYRIGHVEVLFGPKGVVNAGAVGFPPLTRFIMVGDGLTQALPVRELKAIVAHEMAHVLRSDVRNRFLLWLGLGSAWIYLLVFLLVSLGLHGRGGR